MSFTRSRGLTDAGRWTAVATTLAEHLEALKHAEELGSEFPPPPTGAIERARSFFGLVLDGIAFDKNRAQVGSIFSPTAGRRRPSQAMAAGISNLSIAVKVIGSGKTSGSASDLSEVEHRIKSLLQTLDRLQQGTRPLPSTECQSLADFLRELQRQGEIERDATIATQERPRSYSSPIL